MSKLNRFFFFESNIQVAYFLESYSLNLQDSPVIRMIIEGKFWSKHEKSKIVRILFAFGIFVFCRTIGWIYVSISSEKMYAVSS